MRKIILNLFVLILLVNFIGCSSEPEKPPVRVEVKKLTGNSFIGYVSVPIVEVTAVVDTVTIKDVIANNGNCRMSAHRQREFPKKLNYGQKATAGYSASCNLIKVEVVTDKGNWTVEY
ncbi:hypothetical protein [Arcobacter sp.]|uniref:hypothetical protein n=1 Tax=Arcobacter sp. TaxID=1872629 RepID=UPI003D125C53